MTEIIEAGRKRKGPSRVRKRRKRNVIGDLELDGDDDEFDPLEGDGPDGPGNDKTDG